MTRNMITGNDSHRRNSCGAFHPQMSAATTLTAITIDNGWKKSPGFIGKRGP